MEHGADLNARNWAGEQPMHVAAGLYPGKPGSPGARAQQGVLSWLEGRGANVLAMDERGRIAAARCRF